MSTLTSRLAFSAALGLAALSSQAVAGDETPPDDQAATDPAADPETVAGAALIDSIIVDIEDSLRGLPTCKPPQCCNPVLDGGPATPTDGK